MIITIDGPMATGKSTIARLLAARYNGYYMYSGLLFRTVGYILLRDYGYSLETLSQPDMSLVEAIIAPDRCVYHYTVTAGAEIIYQGVRITAQLKSPTIDAAASIVGVHPDVRDALVVWQRRIAASHTIIADGRDCGTTVFPHATYKFFLTATPEIRAQRWLKEQQRAGQQITQEQALQHVLERDARDSGRDASPLQPAPDAYIIDNSTMTLAETEAQFVARIKLREVRELASDLTKVVNKESGEHHEK